MPANFFENYKFFILLSIPFLLTNAALQYAFSNINGNFYVFFWIATGIVFLLKFITDKFLIFKSSNEIKNESILYLGTSILTTIMTMFLERKILENHSNIFLASSIALIIGYHFKYILDAKIVFIKKVTI